MTPPDLPEGSQLPWADFGAAIVPGDENDLDEEDDDESFYMEHQAKLDKAKPQLDGVDAPPTALLNVNQTE